RGGGGAGGGGGGEVEVAGGHGGGAPRPRLPAPAGGDAFRRRGVGFRIPATPGQLLSAVVCRPAPGHAKLLALRHHRGGSRTEVGARVGRGRVGLLEAQVELGDAGGPEGSRVSAADGQVRNRRVARADLVGPVPAEVAEVHVPARGVQLPRLHAAQ